MPFHHFKNTFLLLLLYNAGTHARPESTLGFHGLVLKNKLLTKISELLNKYPFQKPSIMSYEEVKLFSKEITEKINTLATQTDAQVKSQKEWLNKTRDLSVDEQYCLAQKNKEFREIISFEKSKVTRQTEYTFECLETLNNPYFLASLENDSTFFNKILECMNAAEQEAQT
ncbi:MAG TPA: hypothetical protein VL201_05075 [Patescibacteria group bacterium]|jgi:hypothetical protein|nr:hypothetical protein [Patescibacteria group bacterium]